MGIREVGSKWGLGRMVADQFPAERGNRRQRLLANLGAVQQRNSLGRGPSFPLGRQRPSSERVAVTEATDACIDLANDSGSERSRRRSHGDLHIET